MRGSDPIKDEERGATLEVVFQLQRRVIRQNRTDLGLKAAELRRVKGDSVFRAVVVEPGTVIDGLSHDGARPAPLLVAVCVCIVRDER